MSVSVFAIDCIIGFPHITSKALYAPGLRSLALSSPDSLGGNSLFNFCYLLLFEIRGGLP